MTPKRILITNCMISDRSGTELYVRDLAINLLKRGHHPMVWSPLLGELADEFRLAGIPIFDTLHPEMPEPDVLHCHHHDETVAALDHLGTLTRNTIRIAGTTNTEFELLALPTPEQRCAFELINAPIPLHLK